MQTKRLMTNAAMWMVFAFGLGNLCLGQSYWKRMYAYGENFYAIQPTSDSNFLIAGDNTNGRGELRKIKPNGDTLWTKTYDRNDISIFSAIQPTSDDNFLIAGDKESIGSGIDGWLIKIKPNGDSVWTKTYETGDGTFSAILPTTDGNFLLVGRTSSYDEEGGQRGWLLKIKANGDTLWTKKSGVGEASFFLAIQPTFDGNFLIAGNICSNGAGNSDGLLLKIKPNGDTLWTKTYVGGKWGNFSAIQPTNDGNFLIMGSTAYGTGMSDVGWFIKIKPNGDTLWTKTYGGGEGGNFSAIQSTTDGNFLLAGSRCNDSICNGWLIKIKPNGDTLWTKTYYGVGIFFAIQPTTDGNFLVTGNKYDSKPFVLCIIADQYAYKDSRFTYKIPVYSTDTLNFGYAPLKTPSGMTVSAGGTVSWTPKTDSVYMDHAEFIVMNDFGKKDTLTFNIFVNSDYHQPTSAKLSKVNKPDSKLFEINATLLSGKVKFSMPSFVKSISIYDINGRQVGKAAPVMSGSEASVIWPGASSSSSAIPTGKYIAKASSGMNSATKSFLLVR